MRAAIVIRMMGPGAAASVMQHLGPKEIEKIGTAMSQLDAIDQSSVQEVLDEFVNLSGQATGLGVNNKNHVEYLLNQSLGESKSSGILNQIL